MLGTRRGHKPKIELHGTGRAAESVSHPNPFAGHLAADCRGSLTPGGTIEQLGNVWRQIEFGITVGAGAGEAEECWRSWIQSMPLRRGRMTGRIAEDQLDLQFCHVRIGLAQCRRSAALAQHLFAPLFRRICILSNRDPHGVVRTTRPPNVS